MLAEEQGLIVVTSNQSTGHVMGGTKTATKQLPVKGSTTYTPGATDQKIVGGYYLTGTQTIKGDPNLVAANIKSGVSIFGVAGTCKPGADLSNGFANFMKANGAQKTIKQGQTSFTGIGLSTMVWFEMSHPCRINFLLDKDVTNFRTEGNTYVQVGRNSTTLNVSGRYDGGTTTPYGTFWVYQP